MAGKVQLDIRFVVIIVSLLVIATMGSAYVTFVFFSKGETSAGPEEAVPRVKKPEPFGFTYDAGTFTVNLTDQRGVMPRFMRTGVVIAAKDAKVISELETRAPQVRDTIISQLRGRSAAEVLASDGMEVLRQDVIDALNDILGDGKVSDVYFTDFVVQ